MRHGHYEARNPGLGVRFREAVEKSCNAIVQNPLLWRERPEGYRRVNLRGFSSFVAFVVREERVFVLAIAHTSRNPNYFRNRLP